MMTVEENEKGRSPAHYTMPVGTVKALCEKSLVLAAGPVVEVCVRHSVDYFYQLIACVF